MNSIATVLTNSPAWLSPILVLMTFGGVLGMWAMLTVTSKRIGRIEKVCEERLVHCGEFFQLSGEADIKHKGVEDKLTRIEDKLDQIIMKNGWS